MRIKRAAIVVVASFAPIVIWDEAQHLFFSAATPRHIGFHPPSHDVFRNSGISFAGWFLPSGLGLSTRFAALVVVAAAFCLLAWAGLRALPRSVEDPLPAILYRALLLFTPIYFVALLVAATFFDYLPLGAKYIAPLQPVVYLVMIGAFTAIASRARSRLRSVPVLTVIGGVIVLALVALGIQTNYGLVTNPPRFPKERLDPEAVRAIRHLPPRLIATSNPDLLWLATGRSSIGYPNLLDPTGSGRNVDYSAQVADLGRVLRRKRGTLVLFGNTFLWRKRLATLEVTAAGTSGTNHSVTFFVSDPAPRAAVTSRQ